MIRQFAVSDILLLSDPQRKVWAQLGRRAGGPPGALDGRPPRMDALMRCFPPLLRLLCGGHPVKCQFAFPDILLLTAQRGLSGLSLAAALDGRPPRVDAQVRCLPTLSLAAPVLATCGTLAPGDAEGQGCVCMLCWSIMHSETTNTHLQARYLCQAGHEKPKDPAAFPA